MKKLPLLICLTSVFFTVRAQLDNRAFEAIRPVVESDSGKLHLEIRALGFNKDAEYFGTLIDGYTYYGFQLAPQLTYQFAPNWRIEAGVWGQKDFGNSDFSAIAPLFTIRHQKGKLTSLFGTLDGSLSHRLVEPLYDFDRVFFKDRLENGAQLRIDEPGRFFDVWINWQVMQYINDTRQEEITGGVSSDTRLMQRRGWDITLPFQTVIKHTGGQLDINPKPLTTLMNTATGITATRKLTGRFQEIRFSPYLLFYRDASFTKLQPFRDGSGLYLNVQATVRNGLQMMVSYWRGHEFQTIEGGKLYPSIGAFDPTIIRPDREVLMFRFLYTKRVNDQFSVTGRLEPHYDFRFGGFQYAFGVYFNYNDRFYLGAPKRRS